jgi:hypothetical protein
MPNVHIAPDLMRLFKEEVSQSEHDPREGEQKKPRGVELGEKLTYEGLSISGSLSDNR